MALFAWSVFLLSLRSQVLAEHDMLFKHYNFPSILKCACVRVRVCASMLACNCKSLFEHVKGEGRARDRRGEEVDQQEGAYSCDSVVTVAGTGSGVGTS